MNYDSGFFDQECGRVTSAENPFDAKGRCVRNKALPICPEHTVEIEMPAIGFEPMACGLQNHQLKQTCFARQ